MIKAHTLFVVLVISLIISLICGGLIMHVFLQKSYLASGQKEINQIQNINSGFQIVLSSNEIDESTKSYLSDSTLLNHERWGLFELVSVANGQSEKALHKAGLLGYLPDRTQGLYLQDRDRGLTLIGNTIIKGHTYLPERGVKRGYEPGKPFIGVNGQLIGGTITQSSSRMPKCNNELIKSNFQNLHYKHLVDIDYTTDYVDSINIPFFEQPLVIHNNTLLVLDHTSISGKVIISSKTGVVIKRSCSLDNPLIYAPYVLVDDGFVGSVQVFATDSIVTGTNCQFNYPSTLALLTEDHFRNQRIELGKQSTLEGAVLIYRESERKEAPQLIINPNTEIYGQVYVDGSIDHQGSIYGQVWTGLFDKQTITDATIDPSQLDPHFAVPDMMENNTNRVIATWLE